MQELERSTRLYHGTAAEKLLTEVAKDHDRWAKVFAKREARFIEHLVKKRSPSSYALRMAKGIAAAYASGHVARKVGVLPQGWSGKEVVAACLHVFDLAVAEMEGQDAQALAD